MIELELEPETEQRLRSEAAAQGLDITRFLLAKLGSPEPRLRQSSPEEIEAAVQEMLARRIKLAPGETIKELIEEGRRS